MRTVIEIPDEQLEPLRRLGERRAVSRAALVREAIQEYLTRHSRDDDDDEAFGIWRGRGIDGRSYEDALRDEWNR